MRLDEYAGFDGVGLARLVAAGDVTATELAELAIAGAGQLDGQLNAVVEIYDDARDRAAAVDATERPGALAGVPMFRKDIGANEQGKRTELGSRLAEGLVAHRESHLMTSFKAAGLVIVGRSSTSELGCYGTADSSAHGLTENPWQPGLISGGSSGGSAALVASGVVPIAHANDGAGSIRIPASWCGLVGLKPSRGRVSSGPGAGEPNFGGAVQLVVTRTVADTAAALDAAAGPRPGDPFVIAAPSESFSVLTAAAADRSAAGDAPAKALRIGFTTASWGFGEIDAEIVAAVRRTAAALAEAGHLVEEADFPFDHEAFLHPFMDLWAVGVAGGLPALGERMGRPLTAEFLEPVTLAWLEHCRGLDALDVTHALDDVNRFARRSGAYFQRFDVLLCPTMARVAPAHGVIGGERTDLDAEGNARALLEYNPYCPLFNLTGQPALSLPLAQSAGGLPIGVQLVARHAEEAVLLTLGAELESSMAWSARRPVVHVAAR